MPIHYYKTIPEQFLVLTATKTKLWIVRGTPELRAYAELALGGVKDENQRSNVQVQIEPCLYNYEHLLQHVERSEIAPGVHAWAVEARERQAAIKKWLADFRPVPGIDVPLFNTQPSGARFLSGLGRALLTDDTGLGKTRTSVLATILAAETNERALVISELGNVDNWVEEWWKTAPDWLICLPTKPDHIIDAIRFHTTSPTKKLVVILNWNKLQDFDYPPQTRLSPKAKKEVRTPGPWLEALLTFGAGILIGDEIHHIKDHEANQSEGFYLLARRAAHVYGLTATPVHKPYQWFGILRSIDPYRFTAYWRFRKMFTDEQPSYDGRYMQLNKNNGQGGARNVTILNSVLMDYVARREHGPNSGRPPILPPITLRVPMLDLQESAYRQMEEEYIVTLLSGDELIAKSALSQLTRLRQLALWPGLVGASGQSAKLVALKSYIASLEAKINVVVFTSFVGADNNFLFEIRDAIKDARPLHAVEIMSSDTPPMTRADLQKWLMDGRNRTLITSSGVGSSSVNFQGAQIGICLDRPWSSIDNYQLMGRLPRPGNPGEWVQYIDIVCDETVDDYVLECIASFQSFSTAQAQAFVSRKIVERFAIKFPHKVATNDLFIRASSELNLAAVN